MRRLRKEARKEVEKMAVPQKVQREAEEAEKAIQELRDEESGNTDTVNTPPQETVVTDAAPANTDTTPEVKPEATEDTKAIETPVADTEALNTENGRLRGELASLQATLAKVQHQYDVLKGKEYAEVPRLQSENKQLREEIDRLQAGKSNDTGKGGDPDDFAIEYGEEASKALDARLQSVASPLLKKIDELTGVIASLKGKPSGESQQATVTQGAVDSTTTLYGTALMGLVPDMATIRDKPEFAQFLNVVEPFSRKRYLDLLVESDGGRDAEGVAMVYNAFKRFAPSSSTSTPASTGTAPKDKGKLITPGSDARSSAGNLDNTKPTFSRKEIDDHYQKAKKNPALQADPQWTAKSKEYDLAMNEGRIVG
jgi:hypothetical protein